MTPESQRIAIAEACPKLFRVMKHSGDLCWIPPGMTCEQDVDPLNDLNAMHVAEKVLGREEVHKFLDELEHLVVEKLKFLPTVAWLNWLCIHATAAQRAEAFLKTIGKWTEE